MKKINILIIFILLSSTRLLGQDFRISLDNVQQTFAKSITISNLALTGKKLTINCTFSKHDLAYLLLCKKNNIYFGSDNKFYLASDITINPLNDSITQMTSVFLNYIDTLDRVDFFSDCDSCFFFKGIRFLRNYDIIALENDSLLKSIVIEEGIKNIRYKIYGSGSDSIFSVDRDNIKCIRYGVQRPKVSDNSGKNIKVPPQAIPDIIVLFNKQEINAVIIEVSANEVKYKKFDFIDGPTYSVSRKNVNLIQLHNGQTEILNSLEDYKASLNKPVESDNPNVNTSVYGGYFSLGASIGGGALIGIPMRFYPVEQIAFDLTLGVKPMIIETKSSDGISEMNFLYAGGLDLYFTKIYKPKKYKITMHGLFITVGGSTGNMFDESFYAAGWAYEQFRTEKRSFSFKLGVGSITLHENNILPSYYYYYPYYYVPKKDIESLMIFWKFSWNFFM
jgi:hypothetical protein